MKLADLRKVTVKKHLRIRFTLSNGMECIVNEHGVARIPALRAVPTFNLEDELAGVRQFLVEPAGLDAKDKTKPKPRPYTRDEMAAFATAGAPAAAAHDEHED